MDYLEFLTQSLCDESLSPVLWSYVGSCREEQIPSWVELIEANVDCKKAAKKLYASLVELSHNVIRYSKHLDFDDSLLGVKLIGDSTGWSLFFSSYADVEDAAHVQAQCNVFSEMDKKSLRELYLKRRREKISVGTLDGAGLGLIELARMSDLPLDCKIKPTILANIVLLQFSVFISKN